MKYKIVSVSNVWYRPYDERLAQAGVKCPMYCIDILRSYKDKTGTHFEHQVIESKTEMSAKRAEKDNKYHWLIEIGKRKHLTGQQKIENDEIMEKIIEDYEK